MENNIVETNEGGFVIDNNLVLEKDLPQLIVGLDSLDESANYVHIADVKGNIDYYCPCCKGLIKPRAYKKNKDYKVQSHFYHESGGCSEESFVHYICKTWLFEKGCKFNVNNTGYTVSSIETEKTLHTSFGDYRPDIIVNTESGKTFFFEIKYANRKTELYAPKWDELGNDVVEVNAREFINNKHDCSIPEFKLIYSDGECFIKSYSRTDYENTIAKRKLEWKRQDKLNYKIQWERLDWFWSALTDFTKSKQGIEDLLDTFSKLKYSDQIWCYLNIKGKTCVDHKDEFKNVIFNSFKTELNYLSTEYSHNENIKITCNQISPLIYEIKCTAILKYLDYNCFESTQRKTRTKKGILPDDVLTEIRNDLNNLYADISKSRKILKKVNSLCNLPYIQSITPTSHYAAETYPLSKLHFKVCFEDYICNKFLKELIGEKVLLLNAINEFCLDGLYKSFRNIKIDGFKNLFIKHALKNNSNYQNAIRMLSDICSQTDGLCLRVSLDYRRICLTDNLFAQMQYEYSKSDRFDTIGDKVFKIFSEKIDEIKIKRSIILKYINMVNSCVNNMWNLKRYELKESSLILGFCGESEIISLPSALTANYEEEIKNIIYKAMNKFVSGENHSIRIMEER